MKQITYQGLNFVPYISAEAIQARIRELAAQIKADYEGRNPLFLCVLKGAFPFASDLFRAVDMDAEIAFIRLKSYEGTDSTGKVRQVLGLQEDIAGRTVIVIEDIVDTGRTIKGLIETLKERHPDDVKVATLLYKPQANKEGIQPDYVGFEIPTKFIIGFGLDIDEAARNLPDIWVKADN